MSKVDFITVKGFKSIRSLEEFKIGPITVLIGPNGSGKTNLLQVFSLIQAIGQGRLEEYVIKAGGADKVLHFGSRTTGKIELRVSFQDDPDAFATQLIPDAANRLVPVLDQALRWTGDRYANPLARELPPLERESGIGLSRSEPAIPGFVRKDLRSWRVYHFHDTTAASPMKKTASVNDNRYLKANSSNLAPFLYLLRQNHRPSYDRIVATVRQMAPFIREFELEPMGLNAETIRLEWNHRSSEAQYDSASLSDGTLRFIALATLFLQPVKFAPSVILVDGPEQGLHPYAIGLLAALIRKASCHARVVVATQSSLLVDNFEPEEVVVVEREADATTFTRPSSSALEAWLEDYSLGELWEKNVLGGRPANR